MNIREWTLPVYTILTQLSVGALLVIWVIRALYIVNFGIRKDRSGHQNPNTDLIFHCHFCHHFRPFSLKQAIFVIPGTSEHRIFLAEQRNICEFDLCNLLRAPIDLSLVGENPKEYENFPRMAGDHKWDNHRILYVPNLPASIPTGLGFPINPDLFPDDHATAGGFDGPITFYDGSNFQKSPRPGKRGN